MKSYKLVYKFSALILLSASSFIPAFSQPSESSLADIVRQARVIDPSAKLHATVSGDEVDITSESTPKSNDDACKVQAILVAKAIFDSQPDAIQKTKVILFDYTSNKCRTIVVKRAEIKLYASNGMSQSALLSSIDFNVTGAGGAGAQTELKVADGPLQNERLLLLGRITKMKAAGTNVMAFMSIFNDLEAIAATNDQVKTQTKLEYVADKVGEQEKTISAAKSAGKPSTASGGRATISSSTRQNFGGAFTPHSGNANDAAVAGALAKFAHDNLPEEKRALFELGVRQQTLSNLIISAKLIRPDFVGGDERTMLDIEGLIDRGNISQANQLMKVLERKYSQNPY
jgi:hypothetical protein